MHPIERLCSETQNQPLISLQEQRLLVYKAGKRESKYKGVQRGQREKRHGREDEKMRAEP